MPLYISYLVTTGLGRDNVAWANDQWWDICPRLAREVALASGVADDEAADAAIQVWFCLQF